MLRTDIVFRGWLFGSLLIPLAFASGTASPQPSAEQADPAAAAAGTGQDYVVGPGDSLQIFVWRNEELSATVP
ncbi:MAG: hypothetical protein ACREVZ_10940, partial [Burkholderiales bacterium]